MNINKFRSKYGKTVVPRSYSPSFHFALVNVTCISVMLFCLYKLCTSPYSILWWECLLCPLTFFYANLVEYFGHKGPMHNRVPFLTKVFSRHTQQHHQFFNSHHMECDSFHDAYAILFPPELLAFFFVGGLIPATLLVGMLLTANAQYVFLGTVAFYYLNYEWLHFLYHYSAAAAPSSTPHSSLSSIPLRALSWVSSSRALQFLRRHHQLHHDWANMQDCNFNITYPICDLLFGTFKSANKNSS